MSSFKLMPGAKSAPSTSGLKPSIFYSNTFPSRIKRKVSLITHSFYLDAERRYTKTVFICGAGRSGTTWLADVLNHSNDFRVLYEPFNREQVPLCRHFSSRQYLRPDEDDPRYLEPARAIFTGRIRNAWVDQTTRPMIACNRLVKDVRSTLMLKWIREHFPEMPIIFLMRHPSAVAVSRVKSGWRTDLREVFFTQDALMEDHLAPFAEHIASAESPFERHTVDWCVENLVPLSQLKSGDVFLAFYENLCVKPSSELPKLFDFLMRPFDESILPKLCKPSITARHEGEVSAIVAGTSLIDGWREHVTANELSASNQILRIFGLDQIYGASSFADVGKVESHLAKAPTYSGTGRTR